MRPRHNTYKKPKLLLGYPIIFTPERSQQEYLSGDYVGMFSKLTYLTPGEPSALFKISFPNDAPNVLRLHIKYPHTEYRLPDALKSLEDTVRRISNHERAVNPEHDDMFCHITYDRKFVGTNETHRMPGFHVDGFQGNTKPYHRVEHSYVAVDKYPTEFSLRGYDLRHIDDWTHMFSVMDKLTDRRSVVPVEAGMVYLMSCYQVHRTPIMRRATTRTFMRITYAFEELEDNRNTINPCFPGQVYRERGDIRDVLLEY